MRRADLSRVVQRPHRRTPIERNRARTVRLRTRGRRSTSDPRDTETRDRYDDSNAMLEATKNSDRAIWIPTCLEAISRARRELTPAFPESLMAASGSMRAASLAGPRPKSTIVRTDAPTLNSSTRQSMPNRNQPGKPNVGMTERIQRTPNSDKISPSPADATPRMMCSAKSCRMILPRCAPRATQTAISPRRAEARASRMFAMLLQAISRTMPVNPKKLTMIGSMRTSGGRSNICVRGRIRHPARSSESSRDTRRINSCMRDSYSASDTPSRRRASTVTAGRSNSTLVRNESALTRASCP